ncbi:hypothetical protein FACS1894133_6120 [Clostridia bacterium]|nr:hypothetical protein FACS1894133_6120 [Clostridia bacterium]
MEEANKVNKERWTTLDGDPERVLEHLDSLSEDDIRQICMPERTQAHKEAV